MGLSKTKIDCLRKFVDYTCERCQKNEDEVGILQAHRLIRGWENGTYCHRNLKMCCKECHGLFHGNEFSNCKSK